MKVLQIALLVVAGGLAGWVVMRLTPRPQAQLPRTDATAPETTSGEKPSLASRLSPSPAPASQTPASEPDSAQPTASQPAKDSPLASSTQPQPDTEPPAPKASPFPEDSQEPRPAKKPIYRPPSRIASTPAAPSRVTPPESRASRPAPPVARPGRSLGTTARATPSPAHRTYPDEVSVPAVPPQPSPFPAPLPDARQERPTSPAPPPARTEPENVTPPPPPPPPAPEPHRATLNAGTIIPVRLVDGLSTERNIPGDRFTATLASELIAGEFVIAERGARVEGQVVAAAPATNRNGVAILTVMLTRLHTSDGQTVPIRTDGFEKRAELVHDRPARDLPAVLPPDTRIAFRLGVAVNLTERSSM